MSASAVPSMAVGAARTSSLHFLSDPQTREVSLLFDFLDTDRDGLLTVGQAINLCRQLGFNIQKSSLSSTNASQESHVTLRELLGWCESFVAACAHSVELRLNQQFMLLQRGGDGITSKALQRYLSDERLPFKDDAVDLLVEAMADDAPSASLEQFKAFVRKGVTTGPADSDDDELDLAASMGPASRQKVRRSKFATGCPSGSLPGRRSPTRGAGGP